MGAYRQLSDAQQVILNSLPIPSAITSTLGSAAVIHLAKKRRKVQNWTPYTRLLVAMSICDIVFSLNIGVSTFLRPRETSYRLWAFGNDATCSVVGFINQASSAGGICYNGMLSFYFLLTARYGMKNAKISRRIEPVMHLLALGFSIGTAIVGVVVNIYGEKAGAMSCWMSRYDNDSMSDGGKTKESDIRHDFIGSIFFAVPVFAVFICLVINNVVIYLFVRRHTREHPSREIKDSSPSNVEPSLDWSGRSTLQMESHHESSRVSSNTKTTSSPQRKNKDKKPKRMSTSQSKRLQLVCSQVFLFVISFVLLHIWNWILGVLQGSDRNQAEDMEIMVQYYPLAVAQAIILPLQGLFNMIIFVRPKYLMLRLEFPFEARLWTVRRIFLGSQLRPTARDGYKVNDDIGTRGNPRPEAESDGDAPVGDTVMTANRIPRNMISSLTATDGGFDDFADELGRDERWHDGGAQVKEDTPTGLVSPLHRLTTLEAISEMSESFFDLTPYQTNGSHLSVDAVTLPIPTEPSESRWKVTEASSTPLPSLRSSFGVESSDMGDGESSICRTDSRMEAPKRKPESLDLPMKVSRRSSHAPNASDVPIRIPKRTSDPPTDSPKECCTSTSDCSPMLHSKRVTRPHAGYKGKRVFDMPLAPPERFTSLPPSEVEEE